MNPYVAVFMIASQQKAAVSLSVGMPFLPNNLLDNQLDKV